MILGVFWKVNSKHKYFVARRERNMAPNKKQSSTEAAALAARTLGDKDASRIKKQLAGSVLSQRGTRKQTGADLEDKAARVLNSPKYSDETKSLAGSVLSQSNKGR
jgi:hypothetical protein